MKRLVAIIVCLAFATTAASAEALSYSRFRVSATHTRLTYHVDVCAGAGKNVTFQAELVKDDGNSSNYTRTWRGRQQFRCSAWTLTCPDIWIGGLWDTRMTILVNGQVRRTPIRVFYNPD